jgi:predicted deacetylase
LSDTPETAVDWHVLVIANETVGGRAVLEAIERRRQAGRRLLVTVIAPVNQPREGLVVYEDSRRTAARRRLDKTLQALRGAGIHAHGFAVEADPAEAARDALVQLEPRVDEVVVSTHPEQRSGWLRRNVVDSIRGIARDVPVEHVVVDLTREGTGEANVLVIANETVLGEPLLEAIQRRHDGSPASFLIIAPQGDKEGSYQEAERRLRHALTELRGRGIDAHGQVAHPDPHTAIMHTMRDERVDEIIISTFSQQRSGWLRRDLVERVRKDCGVPVEHVVVEPQAQVVA